MNRTKILFGSLFLALGALPLHALETDLLFHLGNMDFAQSRSSTDAGFPGTLSAWGIDAAVSQKVGESVTATAAFTMDPVLRNTLAAKLRYNSTYFAIEGGPFFGVLNSGGTLLKTGLRASLTAQLPGVVFMTFDSGSTIGATLVQTGDYSEELSEIVAGFYVYNAICSLHLKQTAFTQKDNNGILKDSFREYSFQTDVFQKNVPYNVLLKFGYQLQSKYFDYTVPVTHTLASLVLAARVTVRMNNTMSLVTGFESNIYAFGLDALSGVTVSDKFLFRAQAGVNLTLDNLSTK
ncbi:MAG TPA: hypothetical protein VMW87_11915 [Spirochaetia bacterium]|nr:hypothetical protein [Spirochaetia bacterium]